MAVIFWLFLMIAVFWSGFEQAGTSLNIFARDPTDRTVFGMEIPASTPQSVNAGFILLAPLFGVFWVWLDSRQVNPISLRPDSAYLVWLPASLFWLGERRMRHGQSCVAVLAGCDLLPAYSR